MENRHIENKLEAWLAFLSFDEPERIVELITQYPKFKIMYEDIYEMCLNMERVMSMFSKELIELDRNTVRYMMDEMQAELDQINGELVRKKDELAKKDDELAKKDDELARKDELIQKLKEALEAEKAKK